ncbi:MAG: hypothetical protein INQ03_11160 [Candidatus Heimdallarchaeota archaeon]|nr:hypothetical protein [Candidatus Heimdallarchaeota archaeon]
MVYVDDQLLKLDQKIYQISLIGINAIIIGLLLFYSIPVLLILYLIVVFVTGIYRIQRIKFAKRVQLDYLNEC